jgi:tetratricopeptide (TPR) repeat protein
VAEKSQKMTKQELKAPDAFQRVGSEARDWLDKRQKTVAIAVSVVLLGLLAVAIARYFSERGEEQAARELGEQLQVLSRPVKGQEPAEPGATEPPFESLKARDEALRTGLETFRKEHAGTAAAVTAALPLGKAQHRLGDYDAALASFSAYLDGAPEGDLLRAQALEGQGYSYEAKGQYDEALAAFDKLAKAKQDQFLVGMGDYHRGRILVLKGQKDEAAKVLSELSTAHPNTAAARLASERLAVLGSQGVKIPTPAPAPAAKPTPDAG